MTQPVVPPPPVPTAPAAAPAPEKQVAVIDRVGRKGTVPESQLRNALAQGYKQDVGSQAEINVYDDAIKRGFSPLVAQGIAAASPLLTYEQGTVEGATAGLGSGLQRKIAGVVGPIAAKALGGPDMTREQAEEYYRLIAQGGAHGTIHGIGQAAGLVGSTVAGGALRSSAGAAGTVGRGLGLLSEGGSAAARGAASLTKGLAARGALGRAASTAAQFGAQGAFETGAFQGVRELSEEMFGKPELSAEKILAAAADGALGGALIGGGLGAGGSLLKSGALGVKDYASGVLSKNADALKRMADEQRWRALVPRQKFTQEAERRLKGGAAGGGEVAGRYGLTGEDILAAAREGDVAQIAPKIDEALASVGEKIGAARGSSSATVPWRAIDDAVEKVAAPLRTSKMYEPYLNRVEQIRQGLARDLVDGYDELLAMRGMSVSAEEAAQIQQRISAMRDAPIPLQKVVQQRQVLDDLAFNESKSLDPQLRVKAMRDLRGHLEETIMSSFDDAARAAGDKFARANLEQLKHDYQALSIMRDAARVSAPAGMSNRMFGLTDYLAGTAFGGGVTGLAAGAANRFLRTRGNAMAASALDKLAAIGGKPRALASAATEGATGAAATAEAGIPAWAAREADHPIPGLAAAEAEAPVAATPFGPAAPPPELLTRRAQLARELGEIPPEGGPMPPRPGEPPLPVRPSEFDEPLPTMRDVGPEPPAFTKPRPEPAAAVADDVRPFEERLNDALHHLDRKPNGRSRYDQLVPMSEVRKEFPELSREEFDRLILKAERDGRANLKEADQTRNLPQEQKDGLVRAPHKNWRPEAGSEGNRAYAVPADEASGMPWRRAGEGSVDDGAVAAWEAEKAASDAARAEWRAAKHGAEAEHRAAVDEYQARWDASVDAEEAYLRSAQAIKDQHAHELRQWEASVAAEEAAAAERASQFERVQAAIDHVDREIEKAAIGMVAETPKPKSIGGAPSAPEFKSANPYRPGLEAHKSLRRQFDAARDTVARMQDDLAQNIKPTGLPDMPNISQAMAVQSARLVAYLSNQVPQPLGQPILGEPLPTAVTDSDMHAFVQKFKAATNPPAALRQFARGTVTPEQIEAIKFVTPEIYKSLQVKTLEHLRASNGIPFEARQRMALLLDIQTDPSQDPAMARALRAGAVVGMGPSTGMGPSAAPKGKSAKIPSALGLGRYDRLGTK